MVTQQFYGSSGGKDWCDHWKQCVWFVPGQGIPIFNEQEVHLHAVHDEISISYNLKTQSQTDVRTHGNKDRDFPLLLSPERIAIYGDSEWRSFMSTAIRNAVSSLCFCLYHTHMHTESSIRNVI